MQTSVPIHYCNKVNTKWTRTTKNEKSVAEHTSHASTKRVKTQQRTQIQSKWDASTTPTQCASTQVGTLQKHNTSTKITPTKTRDKWDRKCQKIMRKNVQTLTTTTYITMGTTRKPSNWQITDQNSKSEFRAARPKPKSTPMELANATNQQPREDQKSHLLYFSNGLDRHNIRTSKRPKQSSHR